MSEMARRNLAVWQDVQDDFLRSAGLVKSTDHPRAKRSSKAPKKPTQD
jgi:hypothetical protein